MAGRAGPRHAFAANRLVCNETVAYKAAHTDGEQRRFMAVAGWFLGVELFGGAHDHLADGEAYEAKGLP